MFRKILMFAITSGLAARAYKAWKTPRQAAPRVGRNTPEALQVWEDEGGTLPARQTAEARPH